MAHKMGPTKPSELSHFRQYLANKLAACRFGAEYTQAKVADLLGVSPSTIGHWETGHAMPCIEKLVVLSDLYGVTLDHLVGAKERKTREAGHTISGPDAIALVARLERLPMDARTYVLGIIRALPSK